MDLWLAEEIPDPDLLFYRFPVGNLRSGDDRVFPGVFAENKGSMSTDWCKYSSAAQTRSRQGRPARFAIIRLVVGQIREIDDMSVVHSPTQNVAGQPDNRAHTSVFGIEAGVGRPAELGRKERIRTELYRRFNTWEIPPHAPVDPA